MNARRILGGALMLAAFAASAAIAAPAATKKVGKFDVYADAARTGKFDTYSEGSKMGKYDTFTDGARQGKFDTFSDCLLYTSPSPRDGLLSRMPSSA